jgi:hypothetical protein
MAAEASLQLDHVTLHVADLGDAMRRLDERLGLEAWPTSTDPQRHSRVVLDRSYVELSLGAPRGGPPWVLPWFFLRFLELPDLCRARLEEAQLASTLQIFDGEDGCWTELQLDAPASVPLPLLIHRPARPGLALSFPPPMPSLQPCGAFGLAGVCLVTPELSTTLQYYRRLLGLTKVPQGFHDRVFGAHRVDLSLPGQGRIALLQPEGSGFGAAWLATRGPGVMGLLLAVESFWQPEEHFRRMGIGSERGITTLGAELWIDPVETLGIPFGYVEALVPPSLEGEGSGRR